ncbi:MAG: hypothetical protein IJ563_06210 [Selenomonadaceae bacterium]|nr:hypothetical protein [Selenomonadaceae bacterium]
MVIYPETKIYIICPANIHSGEAELMHQLASQLINMHCKVFMFYLPADANFNAEDPVAPLYKKYHIPFTNDVDINHKNILITPEYYSQSLYISSNIRRIIWWLSIDNYINSMCTILRKFRLNPVDSTMPKFFYFDKKDSNITHWVQSDYAELFVKQNGVSGNRIFKVGDYLTETFLSNAADIDFNLKEDIVVFNPVKGFEFTQKLIRSAPDINWQPIRNMTPQQVRQLLARAKVYIDFSSHSGRDRIPREAAVSGCCVITGRRGAAANATDIEIDETFKFDDTLDNVPKIIDRIKDIFYRFKINFDLQAKYRKQIMNEPKDFERDVKRAFKYNEVISPKRVAVMPGLSIEVVNLVKYLLRKATLDKPQYNVACIVDDTFSYRKGITVKSDVIKTVDNINYLMINDISIPLISTADAAFLYRLQRIDKFATCTSDEAETAKFKSLSNSLGIYPKDLLIFKK